MITQVEPLKSNHDIKDKILDILSEVTELPKENLLSIVSLKNDIALDSLMVLDMKKKITNFFPQASALDFNDIQELETIDNIVQYLKELEE